MCPYIRVAKALARRDGSEVECGIFARVRAVKSRSRIGIRHSESNDMVKFSFKTVERSGSTPMAMWSDESGQCSGRTILEWWWSDGSDE